LPPRTLSISNRIESNKAENLWLPCTYRGSLQQPKNNSSKCTTLVQVMSHGIQCDARFDIDKKCYAAAMSFSLRFMPEGVTAQQCQLRSQLVTAEHLSNLRASPEFQAMQRQKRAKAAKRHRLLVRCIVALVVLLGTGWTDWASTRIAAANGSLFQASRRSKHASDFTTDFCQYCYVR